MMKMRTALIPAVTLVLIACSGGGGGGATGGTGPYNTQPSTDNPAPTAPNTINANPAIAYNPQYLTVAPGTTVTFTFFSVQHGVTFDTPGSPSNVPPTTNASVNVVFPTAGTYNFHCPIHSYMTGYVTVQ
jgi:plastocyanin